MENIKAIGFDLFNTLITMEFQAALLRFATTFDPMNPAPPVTKNMPCPRGLHLPQSGHGRKWDPVTPQK